TLSAGASVELSSGTLRVQGGTLIQNGGRINAPRSTAVRLEYLSSSVYLLRGGEVRSERERALDIELGSATLSGGRVVCEGGAAVYNRGSLRLLGSVSLLSSSYDVISSVPVHLGSGGEYFGGTLSLQMLSEFDMGTLSTVLRTARPSQCGSVELFDINGAPFELSYFASHASTEDKEFLGVYRPYIYTYYSDAGVVARREYLAAERPSAEAAPERAGYAFSGWYADEDRTREFDFTAPVASDASLYAEYTLLAPTFSLEGVSAPYSGERIAVDFNSLTHPLAEEGIYSFRWLREDGTEAGKSRTLYVRSVSDSGRYRCEVSFTHGGSTVTCRTPLVTVSVLPRTVALPEPYRTEYTGREIVADIQGSPLYTVETVSAREAGRYSVTVMLTDPINYIFEGGGAVSSVVFEILPAKNTWIGQISVSDIYFGAEIAPRASSRFGTPVFLFSREPLGEYSTEPPSAVGEYYMRAFVEATQSYTELISEPVSFSIISDRPTALTLLTPPSRTEYLAFEYFEREGASFLLTLESGAVRTLGADEVSIFYQSGDGLRFGDGGVIAEYMGVRAVIALTVKKASYGISAGLSDASVVYDGRYHTLEGEVYLPTGLDGITPSYKITGGGTDAGVYTVTLSFFTDSRNYELPPAVSATLTVKPREAEAVWGERLFVYDGTYKCPTAYYTDVFGAKHPLATVGGGIYADDNYSAEALSPGPNYTLLNPKISFSVLRADYDLSGVRWSGSDFVYDGTRRSVYVSGLPEGVSVIGYTDAGAADAGVYYASVALEYDRRNYNEPTLELYRWEIHPGRYDLSGISFTDAVCIYNGREQYPTLSGSLPVGADGSVLGYSLSSGATDVTDAPRSVTLSFILTSDNYECPPPRTATVTVLPLGINVSWGSTELYFDGGVKLPAAYATECAIALAGGGTDAGEYTATARSLNKNYYVINSSIDFTVHPARNEWIETLVAEDVFLGGAPALFASARFGEVRYAIYTDPELSERAELPLAAGRYFAVAYVDAEQNFGALTGSPVAFNCIPVLPTKLTASPNRTRFSAYTVPAPELLGLTVINNDGTSFTPESDSVTVVCESASSLRVGDGYLTVRYGSLSVHIEIEVERANFDTSGVYWSGVEHVYNGEGVTPMLLGLPEGLSVIGYTVENVRAVGIYPLGAMLDYDRSNYNPPEIPKGELVIKKAQITPAFLNNPTYDGGEHYPISASPLYTPIVSAPFVEAGEYTVSFVLTDPESYTLAGDGTAEFVIHRAPVYVTVSDLVLYLFEREKAPTGKIVSGALPESEVKYAVVGERVTAYTDNPNYLLYVTEGELIRRDTLSPSARRITLTVSLGLLLLTLFIFLVIYKRDKIGALLGKGHVRRADDGVITDTGVIFGGGVGEELLSVDVLRAESLISNAMARTLLVRAEETIYTEGRGRAVINLDTLSEEFSAGERVDVNILKERGLVPEGTAYLKVLARGVIDKPLVIYATSFSLSAVKMIALTGGEAKKVQISGKRNDRT
ncbi:MAG: uL15 family ribosomal protein, partial [Clostridia bacterium]|nr:uL15 family ribosomal protein [Clostridia bacterium]